MEDAALVGIEAAATSLGGAAFGAFGGDLSVNLVLLAGLLADGIGRALSLDGGRSTSEAEEVRSDVALLHLLLN